MLNESLFRLINGIWKNPLLDRIIPIFSDKDLVLIPGAVLVGILVYFGGKRMRLCLLAFIPALILSDSGSAAILKNLFGMPRPYVVLEDVHLCRGYEWTLSQPDLYADSGPIYGFPSSHAANAAAVAVVLAILSRRTLRATVPLALLIGYSRIYTGNHYPGDVLAGYLWGIMSGGAAAGLMLRFGSQYAADGRRHASWAEIHPARRTFYLVLGAWTLGNFAFVHTGLFDLAGDEAQYWVWSRELALGYYSKPPMVAYVIAAFSSAGGNEAWAIRSAAVILSSLTLALIYALTLRITKRERTSLLAAMVALALPAMWAGSAIMTVDPLLCFAWAAALYAFHRAVQGEQGYWWVLGFALGFGMLAKYTMILLVLALIVYLVAVERAHLRTRGPYIAFAVAMLCMSGVAYWNWSHDWISLRHTARIGADESVDAESAFANTAELLGAQLGVASPFLFGLMVWAALVCMKRLRHERDAALLAIAFFVVFFAYVLIALTHSPEPNWPVCAYVTGAPALAWVWRERNRTRGFQTLLMAGLVLGIFMGLAVRSTGLVYLAAGPASKPGHAQLGPFTFDVDRDPTNALQGGRELGAALTAHRESGSDEKPFVFSDRYQLAVWSAFYTKGRPRAYCMNVGDRRMNQYDLWGGWDELTDRDGLFVTGGDPLKTQMFINYMVSEGYFESGELLEMVEARRGDIVVRRFSISLMHGYTGKPWPVPDTY
ncbi:MAG: hypothetical protein AMXMBFR82_30410 [Candidatus Hydrogenedentota bacterium]